MMKKRDAIAEALFNVLKGLTGALPNQTDFVYVSRNFRIFDQLTDADLPALCQIYLGETQRQREAFGIRTYEMNFLVQIVFKTDVGESLPGEQLAMGILDSLDTYFPAPVGGFTMPGSAQTLGGMVVQCAIEGMIELDTGVIQQPMVLKIPIVVIAGQ